ncbi:MAG TPA: DUF2007 domain-containing protein [Bacteroidales bacterium]|nr:DUF2007 domain-containing protein [Bacteroidales bacterium]
MEKDWVRIFESVDEIKVELARQILEERGIESVIMNKKDRAYGFGEFELYVLRDFVIRAKQIIKDL